MTPPRRAAQLHRRHLKSPRPLPWGGIPIVSITADIFSAILTVLRDGGLPGLFALMVVESFGIPPLPSEVILPFSGVLIVEGAAGFTWPSVIVVAVAGGVVGAIIAYEIGRWGGRLFIRKWGRRFYLDEKSLDRMEQYFVRYGPVTVFASRLVPVIRAYVSYPAGTAEMPRARFALYTAAGATPFAIVLVYLGTVLGQDYTVLQGYFGYLDIAVVVGLVVLAAYLAFRIRARIRPREPRPPTAPTQP